MSIQTEIKQEKALFAELIKKIKQTKSIKAADIRVLYEERKDSDDITMKYSMDKMNILITKKGFTVKDKRNKTIIKMDTVVPDVEGEALELCKARSDLYQGLVEALELRAAKEQNRLDKLEEIKQAAKRLKASKELRKKQQAESVLTLRALDTIKSL